MYPTPKMVRQAARASMSIEAKRERREALRTLGGVTPDGGTRHALRPRKVKFGKPTRAQAPERFPWGLAWWEGRT